MVCPRYLSAILVAAATVSQRAFAYFGKTTRGKTAVCMIGGCCFGAFVLAFAVHSQPDQVRCSFPLFFKFLVLVTESSSCVYGR